MSQTIYKQIYVFRTPVGNITVCNKEKEIPFDVVKNPYDVPYEVYDEQWENVLYEIQTDTNYAIEIFSEALEVGAFYEICFDGGELRYGGGDEHTTAIIGSFAGYSIAMGAYDPNDDEKMMQSYMYAQEKGYRDFIAPPPFYDESKFCRYDVEISEDKRGYRFKLLDKSDEKIRFLIAWIKNEKFGSENAEEAVEFWVT